MRRIGPFYQSNLVIRGIVCSRRNEDLLDTRLYLDEVNKMLLGTFSSSVVETVLIGLS